MIFNMVGGGSSNPFAMVLVNYPQNSTLTATNVDGYKDIADSTSANPQRLYYVSQPSGETQTCVFTITDGTQTKSETVTNITVGTTASINMSYRLWLYNQGEEYTDVTGGWIHASSPMQGGSKESTHLYVSISGYTAGSEFYTSNLIDLSGYSTLTFVYNNFNCSTSTSTNMAVGLTIAVPVGRDSYTATYVASVKRISPGKTITEDVIDISSVNQLAYIDITLNHFDLSLTSNFRVIQIYAE